MVRDCRPRHKSKALPILAHQLPPFLFHLPISKSGFEMLHTDLYNHVEFTHLSFEGTPSILKIGPFALVFCRGRKVQQKVQKTTLPGAFYMARHPLDIPPSSERVVHTLQVDDWTRVALRDQKLNEALVRYGNVSPTDRSRPCWYETHLYVQPSAHE
jgi:hypothetical protein